MGRKLHWYYHAYFIPSYAFLTDDLSLATGALFQFRPEKPTNSKKEMALL